MTKDYGLYNKPSAAVHQGALAAGTLPQYNTIQYNVLCTVVTTLWSLLLAGGLMDKMIGTTALRTRHQAFYSRFKNIQSD